MIDFSKLGKQSQSSSIEPRDIFMALPEKSEYYEYPRDMQSEVWKQWFESRDNKNTIIKMIPVVEKRLWVLQFFKVV